MFISDLHDAEACLHISHKHSLVHNDEALLNMQAAGHRCAQFSTKYHVLCLMFCKELSEVYKSKQ